MFKILLTVFVVLFAIPVFSGVYSEADERAKNVPQTYERNLSTLVNYLIRPYRTNDVLKARVLYAWIVYHVEYDMYKYDVIMNKNSEHGFARTGDAFKSRVGVCGDIADLFLRMAKAAGIKVDIISGYAGNDLTMDNFKEAGHAWNAVYINGKWFFVDATWGMGGNYRTFENVRSHVEHRRKVRQKKRQKNRMVDESRTVDDKWFLVTPEEMIKTHFPRREKQQHLKRPVDMKKVFRENARNLKRKR